MANALVPDFSEADEAPVPTLEWFGSVMTREQDERRRRQEADIRLRRILRDRAIGARLKMGQPTWGDYGEIAWRAPAHAVEGMYEGGKRGVMSVTNALMGEYSPLTTVPEGWTEEDVARENQRRKDLMASDAMAGASLAVGGGGLATRLATAEQIGAAALRSGATEEAILPAAAVLAGEGRAGLKSGFAREVEKLPVKEATAEEWWKLIHTPETQGYRTVRDKETNKPIAEDTGLPMTDPKTQKPKTEPYTIQATSPLPGVKPDEFNPILSWLEDEHALRSRPGSNQPPKISKEELVARIHEVTPQLKEKWRSENKRMSAVPDDDGGYQIIDDEGRSVVQHQFPNLDSAEAYIEHVEKTSPIKPVKFAGWQTPGGRSYQELQIQLPVEHPTRFLVGDREFDSMPQAAVEAARTGEHIVPFADDSSAYHGPHFTDPDDVNTLMHTRMNEREIPEPDGFIAFNRTSGNRGPVFATKEEAQAYAAKLPPGQNIEIRPAKRQLSTLHSEEFQSDPGQTGRDEGFASDVAAAKADMYAAEKKWNVARQLKKPGEEIDAAKTAYDMAWKKVNKMGRGVPDLPFIKKTDQWASVLLKRMVQEAAARGKDALSWTSGATQVERYRLSNHLKELKYRSRKTGRGDEKGYWVSVINHSGHKQILKEGDLLTAEELPRYVGKEMAKRIIAEEGKKLKPTPGSGLLDHTGVFEGLDLHVGGEGMHHFYDDMLPKLADKLFKRWGAKVEQKQLGPEAGSVPKAVGERLKLQYQVKKQEVARQLQTERSANYEAHRRGETTVDEYQTLDQEAFDRKFEREAALTEEFEQELNIARTPPTVHVLRLTPELKAAAQKEGFTLYVGGKGGAAVAPTVARPEGVKVARIGIPESALSEGAAHVGPDIPIVRMPAGGPVRQSPGGGPIPWAEPNALVAPAKGAVPRVPRPAAKIADPDMDRYLAEQAGTIPLRNAPPEVPAGPRLVELPEHEYAHTYSQLLHTQGPPRKPRSRSVSEIAEQLHERAQFSLKSMGIETGRIVPSQVTPEQEDMLARMIAHEVSQNSIATGKAGDWYTDGVDDAVAIAHMMHPEMTEKDPATGERTRGAVHLDTAFKLGLAVTSQGEAVNNQTRLTNDTVFEYFKQHGRFPTDVEHSKQGQVNGNFQKLNDLIEERGMDGMIKFLDTKFTVGELEAMGQGYTVSGMAVDDEVYGSAILGAKIGNGFYQNLNGKYDVIAFDLWWTRAWNRLTGNLYGQQDPDAFEKTKDRYRDALREEGRRAPLDNVKLLEMAENDRLTHERLYRKYGDEFKAGKRDKTERTKSAVRFVEAMQGVNQMPKSPAERRLMKRVAEKAVGVLKEHGIHVTPADMQALWWYPEKDLYERMGGRGVEDLNVDYASAMRDLALERGFTQKQVDDAKAAAKAAREQARRNEQ